MTMTQQVTSTDQLMVVETHDTWFLGTLEVEGDVVTVRTGLVGKPKVLALDEIVDVTPAEGHPDVEGLDA